MAFERKTRFIRANHPVISGLFMLLIGVSLGYTVGRYQGGQPADDEKKVAVIEKGVEPDLSSDTTQPGKGEDVKQPPEYPAPVDDVTEDMKTPPDDMTDAEGASDEIIDEHEDEVYEDVWPARHLFVSINGTELDEETKALLEELKPGGIVLVGQNIENRKQTTRLIEDIKHYVGLGGGIADLPLIAACQEGGTVNRLNLKDAPSAGELGRWNDLEKIHETALGYAASCKSRGIGVVLAPVLDIVQPQTPEHYVERCFGDTREKVAAMGLTFADGLVEGGVLPVVKHFPGLGAAERDSKDALAMIQESDLHEVGDNIFPFAEAIARRIPGLMIGHIAVPVLDKENPDTLATFSHKIISELVRGFYEYDNVIIADDIAMGAVAAQEEIGDAAVKALAAGCDALILADPDPDKIISICVAIESAVANGELSRGGLRKSKDRLDAWQAWLKDPQPLTAPPPELPAGMESEESDKQKDDKPADTSDAEPLDKSDDAADEKTTDETEEASSDDVTLNKSQPDAPESSEGPQDDVEASEEDVSAEIDAAPDSEIEESSGPEKSDADTESDDAKPEEEKKLVFHKVVRGDTMSSIVRRYGVSMSDLRKWNNISGSKILLGQKLRVSASDQE